MWLPHTPRLSRPKRQRSMFEWLVLTFMLVIFIVVIGGIILTFIAPEQAGKVMAPAVKAQDQACTEGCQDSVNPEACYDGCMRSYQRNQSDWNR